MNRHIDRLKRLVEGLPNVEPEGRHASIATELQAIDGAFEREKQALADALHHYVAARGRGTSTRQRATLHQRVMDALEVLIAAVENKGF